MDINSLFFGILYIEVYTMTSLTLVRLVYR